jgi:hypothetical protein
MALRTRTRLAALVGALLLAGCAYGPPANLMVTKTDDTSFGYSDRQVGASQYEVSYVGPEVMTREIVPQWVERAETVARDTTHDLALWRAAQVARQKGAPEFVVTHTKSEMEFYIVGRDYREAPSVYQGVTPVNPLYVSAIYFRPRVTLSVDLDPAAKGDRHDTQQVADRFGRKYAQGIASAGVPQGYFYFGPSAFIQKYRTKIEAEARAEEARKLGGPESYISTGPPYYRPYNGWK